jgi:hypothetical protein
MLTVRFYYAMYHLIVTQFLRSLFLYLEQGGFGPFISVQRDIGDYSFSVGQVTYQVNGADVASKIDDLDLIMTSGRLSAENKQVLSNAYKYFFEAHNVETADRVLMGLMTATPEFQTSNTRKSDWFNF